MKKFFMIILFLVTGCTVEQGDETPVSPPKVLEQSDETPVSPPKVLEKNDKLFFGSATIFGESFEIYLSDDFDSGEGELLEYKFEDSKYSFRSDSIFVLDEDYVSLEDYLGNGAVYVLSELVVGGIPIEFSFDVNESDWTVINDNYLTHVDVLMLSEYEVYPLGVTEVNVKIINNTDGIVGYGEIFELHKWVEGAWRLAERNDGINREFILPLHSLTEGEMWKTYYVDMFTFYMSEGQYRIVSKYTFINENFETESGEFWFVSYFDVGATEVKRDF